MKMALAAALGVAALLLLMLAWHEPVDLDTPTGDQLLPWQIAVFDDGTNAVFGLRLGHSTVAQSEQRLGKRARLALFETGEALALEVYFGEVALGGLSGHLMGHVDLDRAQLEALRARAGSWRPTEAGGRRMPLSEQDEHAQRDAVLAGLAYVPHATLDPAVLLRRFGEPTERVRLDAEREHWLYPDRGLDILTQQRGREVLQYVPPRDFERLRAPLFDLRD